MDVVSNEKLPAKQIINCAAYAKGRRVADVELNRVHEILKEPNQFVWIALHEPSEETLARVQQEFGLHDQISIPGIGWRGVVHTPFKRGVAAPIWPCSEDDPTRTDHL